MSFGAVHQFHSGTDVGDAITNQMFDLQRRLRSAGYYSEIYSEHIPTSLCERVKPLSSFEEMPSTLLLTHHSMGHTAFAQLAGLRVPMVTVFHSITPAHFFDDLVLRQYIRLGFRQLRELAELSLFGVADSNHNRQQMYDAGFTSVEVMPVRTDFHEERAVRAERVQRSHDWLFVGRVVPNKRQVDLVRAFALHHRSGGQGSLHLVGDLAMTSYVQGVRHEIDRLGLTADVVVHGKVGQRGLLDRYRDAGLFVCMSEHEGFGVPLLEAMAAGVPVVARDEAAVAETMGGAGALVTRNDPATVAALARVIDDDDGLRSRMIDVQDRRIERIEGFGVDQALGAIIERAAERTTAISVQVQGPFETTYSLAILNRELALSLAHREGLDVSIHATEGPGDYTPSTDDLMKHPAAARLYEKGLATPYPQVAIRQMFPPRVNDSTAGLTFQYFGWEESRVPPEVVADFNRHLDGVGTMSTFVKQVLTDSGVTIPLEVVGVGVHPPDPHARCTAVELVDARHHRLLHISSAFPRKGVDALLQAYFEAFTDADDVSLILKTFPNVHNSVGDLLMSLRAASASAPHVCWIDRDLDRDELDGLYHVASAYVHAARGEGFGLPVAEAMLAGVPVISVASTGLADFVSSTTAAVVGHQWAEARTHVSVPGSQWAEPSIADLRREMRSVVKGTEAQLRSRRVIAARALVETEHTWRRVADRWAQFVDDRRHARTGLKVAAITTSNSRCGIAEYAAHLHAPMSEWAQFEVFGDRGIQPLVDETEELVLRTWDNHRAAPIDDLLIALDASDAALVHIQYNFGFFSLHELGRLIRHEAVRRPVIVTMHRTAPLDVDGRLETMHEVAADLARADAIIVHQTADRDRLEGAGVVDRVHVIPHGTEASVPIDPSAARQRHGISLGAFVIGTYGFLLPHKGLVTVIRALADLRRCGIDAVLVATCALHPDPSSAQHHLEVEREIARLDLGRAILLHTEYLEPAVSRDLLACADVLVFPYEETNESASGALRSVLPLGRAVVTSDLPIFDDLPSGVPSLSAPVDPLELANVLAGLWLRPESRDAIAAEVRQFAEATSWSATARRTRQLYHDVITARSAGALPEVAC